MVKVRKKERPAVFRSAVGCNIKLDILVKEDVLKVTVLNLFHSALHTRGIIYTFLVIINFLSYFLNLLNVKFLSAVFIVILFDLYRLGTMVKEESLVTIKGLGLQVTTKYVLGVKTEFIPQEQVQHIFINEVIFRSKVVYVLSLLTKDTHLPRTLIPLFSGTLPKLACLKVIYKHCKSIFEKIDYG